VAEILGALAVLASLVYVATQIRDNTRSLEAASLQSVLDGPRDRSLLPMATNGETSDIFARGLNSFDDLDEGEKRRFCCIMVEHCFQIQQVMHLHERGLIPELDYEAWLIWTVSLVRTPGGASV
jgi:hypothetical protein